MPVIPSYSSLRPGQFLATRSYPILLVIFGLFQVATAITSAQSATLDDAAVERSEWRAHDTTRPKPPIVTPPKMKGKVAAPSDAIVLFDGADAEQWQSGDQPSKWIVENGDLISTPGSGPLRTKASFGDVQLHVEWAAPTPPQGRSQGRGNSGIYFMSKYEVQVLDSYENETYADGQAASMYGQNPPAVNACLPPGEWQSYDIIFRRPRFHEDGTLQSPAIMTVFHNNVLVQDNFELWGPTNWLKFDEYQPHADKLPIMLQDHGNPVRFRSIWLRELADRPTARSMQFAEPQLELSSEQLELLAGNYSGRRFSVRDGNLIMHMHGRTFELVPQSPTRFEFKRTYAFAEFKLNEAGESTSVRVRLMEGDGQTFERSPEE